MMHILNSGTQFLNKLYTINKVETSDAAQIKFKQ